MYTAGMSINVCWQGVSSSFVRHVKHFKCRQAQRGGENCLDYIIRLFSSTIFSCHLPPSLPFHLPSHLLYATFSYDTHSSLELGYLSGWKIEKATRNTRLLQNSTLTQHWNRFTRYCKMRNSFQQNLVC